MAKNQFLLNCADENLKCETIRQINDWQHDERVAFSDSTEVPMRKMSAVICVFSRQKLIRGTRN
jgi:hypothetical protein